LGQQRVVAQIQQKIGRREARAANGLHQEGASIRAKLLHVDAGLATSPPSRTALEPEGPLRDLSAEPLSLRAERAGDRGRDRPRPFHLRRWALGSRRGRVYRRAGAASE
jgi:hypothetical protein